MDSRITQYKYIIVKITNVLVSTVTRILIII